MTKRWGPRGTLNASGVNTSGSTSTSPGGGSQQASQDTLTAHAGGGQGSATQLNIGLNRVTTTATAADSVKLPASYSSARVIVTNSGASSMQVFGTSPDTINGVATGTGVAVAAGKTAEFVCYTAGAWFMNLSA